MDPWLAEYSQGSPEQQVLGLAVSFFFYLVAGFLPAAGLFYLVYFLATLPMRRNERARMFLDLLELGFKAGRAPETTIVEAAASRDRSLGARFHLLAARIETGERLGRAVAGVPRLLPPQVVAMLAAGERIGDVAKVLPACALLLRDSVSQVRGALNYLLLMACLATPFSLALPLVVQITVLPKFEQIFAGMTEGVSLPAFTRFVFAANPWFTGFQMLIIGLVWLVVLAYLGGPRLGRWLGRPFPGVFDRLQYLLPWRRKRLQRDFASMLAVLLDAEVPEPEAVRLAGDATANAVLRRRAEKVCALLKEGVNLPEALRALDGAGELRWRLANASLTVRGRAGVPQASRRRPEGFARALAGWCEALDAKAFQLEQSAAQIATTLFVLFNGVIIACVVIGMFLPLIQLLTVASLW